MHETCVPADPELYTIQLQPHCSRKKMEHFNIFFFLFSTVSSFVASSAAKINFHIRR